MKLFINDKKKLFPFNNRGDFSFSGWNPIHAVENWVESVNIWATAGYPLTTTQGAKKIVNSMKGPNPVLLPNPDDATQKAYDAQVSQRRALLASGGLINITGGSANILGSDIHTLNLAGA